MDGIAWGGPNDTFIPDGEHVWRVWCEYATVLVARSSEGDSTTDSDGLAGALVMFPTTGGQNFLHKVMVDPRSRGRGVRRPTLPPMLPVPPNSSPEFLRQKSGAPP